MKRKSEQFGHKSFLGQNCPERKLQKRAFIKLIFYVFYRFRIDKSVHELLGHPLLKLRELSGCIENEIMVFLSILKMV